MQLAGLSMQLAVAALQAGHIMSLEGHHLHLCFYLSFRKIGSTMQNIKVHNHMDVKLWPYRNLYSKPELHNGCLVDATPDVESWENEGGAQDLQSDEATDERYIHQSFAELSLNSSQLRKRSILKFQLTGHIWLRSPIRMLHLATKQEVIALKLLRLSQMWSTRTE